MQSQAKTNQKISKGAKTEISRCSKMKKLTDYKEEIHKCSKCGLCQSVCPIYEQTHNDCAVSRGKFIMLNGVAKGDLKLNQNISKYLDMCLKCNACKNFCPSGIDARKIFLTAKAEYFKKCPSSFFIKIFQSRLIFNMFLNLVKIASKTYRKIKLDKLARKFYPILNKFELGKKAILANEFISIPNKTLTYNRKQIKDNISKIVYFKGCVNEYINPRTKNATEVIFKTLGIEVLPIKFECCGMSFLSCGNAEQFKKQAEYNLKKIPEDFDYFLTDCASCQDAFKDYENYFDDPKLLEKLKKVNEKSMNVVDFVMKNVRKFEFEEKISFTFHKPCHLEDMNFLDKFLKKAKGIEYRQMNEFDKCCGFAGEFAIRNQELSETISAQKIKNALETKADYIVTSCPSCILGLNQGLIENFQTNIKNSPINFIEFLSLMELKLDSDYENEDCEKKLLDAFVRNCF